VRLPLESPDFGLATIGGISLHTPAWQCTNTYLLTDPAPRRRNNRVRPGVAGTYGGPGFRDEWQVELEIAVNGWWNFNGTPATDPAATAEAHYLYLVENILDASDVSVSGDAQGRLACTVTSAITGGLYSGYVQIDSMTREPLRHAACVYMNVTLPSGGLTYTGP
jgi:hypothetical protein